MPVLLTIVITCVAAISTAVLGLFGAGFLATFCVRWYHISSFEGGSGYFVMFIGLFGGIAGLGVGLGTALYCLLAGTRFEGWSAVPIAWGVAASILVVASGLSFLLAPPASPSSAAASAPAVATDAEDDAPPADPLGPSATLEDLLQAFGWTGDPTKRAELGTRIAAFPDLSERLDTLVVDEESEIAASAIGVLTYLPLDAERRMELLVRAGEDIAERVDRFEHVSPEADPSYEGAADAGRRFSAWVESARLARAADPKRIDDTLGPLLVRMLEGARRRPDSHVFRQDICRVASYYANQWLQLAPAAGDPAPR